MGYALFIPRGRRTLTLKLYSFNFEKIHLEGTVNIRDGKIWNLHTRKLSTPVARKELLKLLKGQKILFSSEHSSTLEPIIKREKLSYQILEFCTSCLSRGIAKPVKKNYYIVYGRKMCKNCAEEELNKELKFRGFSPASFEHFSKLLYRLRNFEKISNLLQSQSLEDSHTLYDRVKSDKIGGIKLDKLPINKEFMRILKQRNIKELTSIQKLAIDAGLLKKNSLLVASSTASGKTLIAELAGIEAALRGEKFLFLVPLVALANQKYEEFKSYLKLGLKVAIRVGRSRIVDDREPLMDSSKLKHADIVVGTYEGIDYLLRAGNKDNLGKVGVVAVDEVHTLSQEERGIELDGFLSRLEHTFPEAQIIALTATVGNPKEIAEHYSLKLVESNSRPIPLERHLVFIGSEDEKLSAILKLVKKEASIKSSKGFYGQSLIFTNSRRKASSLAGFLSDRGIRAGEYHAGLSYSRRKRIEKNFIEQRLNCVVATAALGTGIDFPASQVIFGSLTMGNKKLEVRDFLQMQGRAGRPSYHDRGRVVILAMPGAKSSFSMKESEDEIAVKLLSGKPEDIEIPAEEGEDEMQLLACMVSAGNVRDGVKVAGNMLFPVNNGKAIKKLEEHGMIKGGKITQLGRITSIHFLKPQEAKIMYFSNESPEKILSSLFPFTNAYLSRSLVSKIQKIYRVTVPMRYFDALGIIFQEPRKEFMDIIEMVRQEFLICSCEEFPYCQHSLEMLSEKIIMLRRQKKNIKEISRSLSAYHIETFSGDIFNYLDTIVKKAEGFLDIMKLRKSSMVKDVERLIKEIEGYRSKTK